MAAAFAASPRQTAAPAVTAFRGGSERPTVQRAPLRLSLPQDTSEREAAAAARTVMTMHLPRATAPRVAGAGLIQRSPAAAGGGGGTAARLPSSPAGGTPLPAGVRSFMEPRFGADFGAVRMHTDANAAVLSRQLAAQAFTTGNHIYFGGGQYQPETASGRELIAHELAHTVQQGAAPRVPQVQRSADLTLTPQPSGPVQRLGLSDALDFFADRANLIPGFRMFTIVLGVNPINMSRVERSAANILRALVELLPGGALITQALDNHGVFDRVGTWVEQQIRSLGMTGSMIRDALNRFLDSLSWRDIFNLGGVWERARRIFSEPIDRILAFGRGLVNGIIQFVKDAILMPLARLASNTRGWDLLCAVLGRNPITGDAVPRNADTLIGGFMKLIGQEEVWENIKRGNAVARAWAWFQGALAGVMAFVREIPTLFVQALRSLEIADIVLLPRAFAKVASVFGSFALRFVGWAGQQVLSLLQIIFEVVAPQVMVYLRRAAGAFGTIVRDPGRFIGNLVRAGLQGLRQFAGNFLTHLRASLIGWLTGAMSGANIYIPQGFNLREIVKFILSVLGLTWQNIRAKLVRAIGETAVAALETGFDIVMTLVREGPAAAWDKIVESITNLRDMVIEQVMTFVRDRIVTAAITRLVSMLNPVGAFIQAIIAIYNTVMFFVERLRQIAQVAAAVIDSLAAIAAGVITAAANRVEQTMAGLLTLVISFLARIAGLGRVSDAVINIINRVRQPIDQALDRVVAWIVAQARRLFARIFGSGGRTDSRTAAQKETAVEAAKVEAERAVFDGAATPARIQAGLAQIKTRHGLTRISLEHAGDEYDVVVEINPRRSTRKKRFSPSNLTVGDVVLGLYKDPRWLDPDKEKWIPGVVVTLDSERGVFNWRSTNLKVPRTARFVFDDHEKKWRKGHTSQRQIPEDAIIEQNQQQEWPEFEAARTVLNYRHHKSQFNVGGTQWEHIIERSAGGRNSSGNLALTASTINNRLGVLFGRPYASHEAPPGQAGTQNLPLREYLRGKSLFVQNVWKQHFYAELRVRLKWSRSERGIWRELN